MEPDWFLHHPKLLQVKAHGFDDPPQSHAVFQSYLDLAEVKLWHKVSIHPCPELKLVYLTAQEREDVPHLHILPLPADTVLTLERFDQYFKALAKCERERVPDHHQSITRMTLALVDSDSTVIYYHIHKGMHPWPSTVTSS